MDIDAALRMMREAVTDCLNASNVSMLEGAADRMTVHWDAIDAWMSKGGDIPTEWKQK